MLARPAGGQRRSQLKHAVEERAGCEPSTYCRGEEGLGQAATISHSAPESMYNLLMAPLSNDRMPNCLQGSLSAFQRIRPRAVCWWHHCPAPNAQLLAGGGTQVMQQQHAGQQGLSPIRGQAGQQAS